MRLTDDVRDTDYMRPLEGEPVSGDTVKVVEGEGVRISEKWSDPIEQSNTKEPVIPWEEHRTQGREALRTELQQAATHSIRAAKWADVQTDLPDGLLTDIRAIAEKLRQTVQALS